MAHEVELKFDVEPGDVALIRGAPALAAAAFEEQAHDTIYFDTKDGALRRSGFSVRVRRSGDLYVQTVKRKRGSSAGLFVRQEWEAEVAGFKLDRKALKSPALYKLLDAIGPKALIPLIRSRFRRTSWQIDHEGSRIEVVLDEGNVASGKEEAPLCELELELKEGKPRALFDLAGQIGGAAPLRIGVLTKAERGYALAESRLGRAAKAEPVDLAAPVSEADAFRAAAHACLRHYRLNEIVLLGGADADSLHQARIALRRLRSAFSLFRPTAAGKDFRQLREELGWLAGQFGDARNLDVLLGGESALPDGDPLRPRLLKARAKAYDRVGAALGSERARSLVLRLTWWIEMGAWRFRERAARDVAALAVHSLERQWRRIRRRSVKLEKLDATARHQLRIDVKKLRYAAEFLAGLWAKKADLGRRNRFIAALKEVQEELGDLNDAEAAEALTARLAPGLRGSADRIRQRALAAEGAGAAEAALNRASAAAGYWL
ncbi:MAG TPA: CHAD domain-containing protein [Allosphingosinicella sp.]|nr:CHAD domain-containing protein [Allosphingosinicella sp.]